MEEIVKEDYDKNYSHAERLHVYVDDVISEAKIESKDFNLDRSHIETPLLLISNQGTLGGKFTIAPGVGHDTGTFSLTIFLHKTKKEIFKKDLFNND